MPLVPANIFPPAGPVGRPTTPPMPGKADSTQLNTAEVPAHLAGDTSRIHRDVARLTGRSAQPAFSPNPAQPTSALGALAAADDLSAEPAQNPLAGSGEGLSNVVEKTFAMAASVGGAGGLLMAANSFQGNNKGEEGK